MATKVKHRKLSIKRAFKNIKPVSYAHNEIISGLILDQDDVIAKYMGAIKPKRKSTIKK